MKQISYKDIQYKREVEFFNKLFPLLENLRNKYKDFSMRTQEQEKNFFNLLSHSIKIDGLKNLSHLIDELNECLNTDFKINLFLFESPTSNAFSVPRYAYGKEESCKELVILISQHFLNNLNPDEQKAILGHELAHMLYGHVHIPAKIILQSEFPMKDIQDLKSNVLKWLICAEISCDIVGFLSCNCNVFPFHSALLKYSTGLNDETIHDLNQVYLIELLLKQFEEISESLFENILTTHPLTPLRLKIINSISHANLIKYYGKSVPENVFSQYKNEFNSIIDESVSNIYPEIISNKNFRGNDILFQLGVAVALSDGHIDKREFEAIKKIIESETDIESSFNEMINEIKIAGYDTVIKNIIDKSLQETKKKKYLKSDIIHILKHLLIVAASDGIIKKCELETIFNYSKENNVGKQEIIFLINQMNLS